jgi:hypothetical protein
MGSARALLLATTVVLGCTTVNLGREPYADRYLADPGTPDQVRVAIRDGVVLLGMCPTQAVAAAGAPGPGRVDPDPARWSRRSDPVKVVEAQCQKPDRSLIELTFANTSQFGSYQPVVFRVRFVDGRAALLAVEGFAEY